LKDYPNDQSIQVQLLATLATVPQPSEKSELASLINTLEKQSQLSPQTQFILAEVLYQSAQTDKAITLWESLASRNHDPRAQLRLSEVALTQGKGAQACPNLDQLSTEENSWSPQTRAQWWALRAICAETRKDMATAIQAHRKAIELSPKDPVFANNLASTLADQGQNLDEAQRLAERAVASQPTNVQYLDTLGWVYYRKGDQNRARKIYQQLSGISPLPPNVQTHLSSILGAR
jgi:Flp pilus assembly protein TadD